MCNCRSHDSTSSSRKSKHDKSKCDKCVCDILRRLCKGTEVDVFLSGGTILEDVIFKKFDDDNCCATFKDEEEEPGTIIFVDCRDIQALRVE